MFDFADPGFVASLGGVDRFPEDIEGLWARWSARTVAREDQAVVNEWPDISGNGRHLTVGSGVFDEATQSVWFPDFEGGMATPTAPLVEPVSVLVHFKGRQTGSVIRPLVSPRGGSGTSTPRVTVGQDSTVTLTVSGGNTTVSLANQGIDAADRFVRVAMVLEVGQGRRLHAEASTATAATAIALAPILLALNGGYRVKDALVYERALTPEEVQTIFDYWGAA